MAASRAPAFPRLRDDLLELGSAESERVLLPTGLRGRVRGLIADAETNVEFYLAEDATGLSIRWKHSDRQVHHEVTVPLGRWEGTTAGKRFTFEFVKPSAQQVVARSLLVRSHPLGAPNRGVLLAARYTDLEEGRAVYHTRKRKRRPDPWSDAWRYVPRAEDVVGVVVIDRLLHGDPRGRDCLAETMGIRLPDHHAVVDADAEGLGAETKRKRSDVVDALGVMWLSRIAVDAPYRGQQADGVGQALVAEARSALRRLPWDARSVEVIRTIAYETQEERARADQLIRSAKDNDGSAHDFLTGAGYALAPEPLRSLPVRPLDDTGTRSANRRTTKKLYYYALTQEPR